MQQWTAIIEYRIASGLKIDEYCEKNRKRTIASTLTILSRFCGLI